MDISIVIVNYRVKYFLEQTLLSAQEALHGLESEIFVIDNASGDDERDKLYGLRDRCELLFLDDNGGYAAGNNEGIRRAVEKGCDVFLVANSDTRIRDRNTISRCLKHMKDNDIAILGPRMIDDTGKDVSGYVDDTRLGRTERHLTGRETVCRGLVGAFIFIDRSVVDTIGYLNEDYFLYLEETDYCARAYRAGFKIVYYPVETIIHRGSATTGKVAD